MEVILQWLDELDDLIFAMALSWRSACRIGLVLGFMAAVVLTPEFSADLRIQSVMILSTVSVSSVVAWLVAAAHTMWRQTPPVAASA